MFGLRVTLFGATFLLAACMTQGTYLHGLCRRDVVGIVPMDYQQEFRVHQCWDIYYVTKAEIFLDVDHAYLKFSPNCDGTNNITYTRVRTNGSIETDTYFNYYRNIALNNEFTEDGEMHMLESYPLAITPNNAVLYVRCSYEGDPSTDIRYMVIPTERTMTDSDVSQLLEVDKKYNFRGELFLLPNKLGGKCT